MCVCARACVCVCLCLCLCLSGDDDDKRRVLLPPNFKQTLPAGLLKSVFQCVFHSIWSSREHLTTHITLVDAILSSVCHLMYHQVWSLGERLFTHITLERPLSSVSSLVTVHFHVRAGCECFSAYVARIRLLSGACLLMCCQGCSMAESFFAHITLTTALSLVCIRSCSLRPN